MAELTTFPVILEQVPGKRDGSCVVTSPDLPGLRVVGQTSASAMKIMQAQILEWLKSHRLPTMTDPETWDLAEGQPVTWVGLPATEADAQVTLTITLPADLADWADAHQIDLSQVTTQALRQLRG